MHLNKLYVFTSSNIASPTYFFVDKGLAREALKLKKEKILRKSRIKPTIIEDTPDKFKCYFGCDIAFVMWHISEQVSDIPVIDSMSEVIAIPF